ncbi:DsbE family thiol:disulfide interchange protein [Enterobacteriaceae bacterium 89]|nr:DsbE family thiol:disulfide interchange protein [Enterobacteriaceae bacterium 89]
MKAKILILPLLLFIVIAAVLFWQLARNAQGDDPSTLESALVGKAVPDFTRQSLSDANKRYPESLFITGKPLLLNVWATWCPTCAAEHRYLNELKAEGVPVIGLNFKDDREKALRWLQRGGDPYTANLFDGDGMAGLDLGVYGAPETFLIDGKGVIRFRYAGELTAKVWQNSFAPLWARLSQEGQG